MKIYTTYKQGKNCERMAKIVKYGCGIMLTPLHYSSKIPKSVTLALDNGAYSAWHKGLPFDEYAFLRVLSFCIRQQFDLEFIVAPDLIGGGLKSLDFSLHWRARITATKVALVVQPGFTPSVVEPVIERFSHIFIGGGNEGWKWATAPMWTALARDYDKKVHIGRCGNLDRLIRARELGVDSIDSCNYSVDKHWHIIEQFNGNLPVQLEFFDESIDSIERRKNG